MPVPDPGAQRSLRARLTGGPIARAVARVDVRVYRVLRGSASLHHRAAEPVIRRFSMSGEHAALWYLVGSVGLAASRRDGDRERWRRALLGIFVTQVVNVAAKGVVRRKRPELEGLPALVAVPTSLSFPSSHASTSFAAAAGYRDLLPAGPLRAAAAAMAVSRVYLGVHYPSDIVVGALLGTAISNAVRA